MARCECNQNCNCFVLDDSYDGFGYTNNQTTYIEGIGLSNAPYIVHNIHDPEFIPPTAKVSYDGSTFASDFPGASPGGQIPAFTSVDFNPLNLYNPNQPDRITVLHPGIYFVGFDVGYDLDFSGASSTFTYETYVEFHQVFGADFHVAHHQYFETTSIWPLQVRSTQTRIVPFICDAGDYFTLHVGWDLKPLGITGASMWVCYT